MHVSSGATPIRAFIVLAICLKGTATLSLLLNFSPIEFEDAEIDAGLFSYGADGKQVLKNCVRRIG
jgi:hypothetical protein